MAFRAAPWFLMWALRCALQNRQVGGLRKQREARSCAESVALLVAYAGMHMLLEMRKSIL